MTVGDDRAGRLRELRERQALPPGSREEAEAARAYEVFRPLNREVLQLCSDWQVRPGGAPNDHADAAYDWSVIHRLRVVPRFAPYREQLRDARRRVVGDEHEWFTSPRVASYHTVWMELHEELLTALGLERRDDGGFADRRRRAGACDGDEQGDKQDDDGAPA